MPLERSHTIPGIRVRSTPCSINAYYEYFLSSRGVELNKAAFLGGLTIALVIRVHGGDPVMSFAFATGPDVF